MGYQPQCWHDLRAYRKYRLSGLTPDLLWNQNPCFNKITRNSFARWKLKSIVYFVAYSTWALSSPGVPIPHSSHSRWRTLDPWTFRSPVSLPFRLYFRNYHVLRAGLANTVSMLEAKWENKNTPQFLSTLPLTQKCRLATNSFKMAEVWGLWTMETQTFYISFLLLYWVISKKGNCGKLSVNQMWGMDRIRSDQMSRGCQGAGHKLQDGKVSLPQDSGETTQGLTLCTHRYLSSHVCTATLGLYFYTVCPSAVSLRQRPGCPIPTDQALSGFGGTDLTLNVMEQSQAPLSKPHL